MEWGRVGERGRDGAVNPLWGWGGEVEEECAECRTRTNRRNVGDETELREGEEWVDQDAMGGGVRM